jgi:large subunit ribosomal protein L32e
MKKEQLLTLRKRIKSRKPAFVRQMTHKVRRLQNKIRWRKPHGYQSKLQQGIGHRKMVSPGYSSPKEVKGLHRSGLKQVVIHNASQLDAIDPKIEGIIVAGSVGMRKKVIIISKALEKKITILNRSKAKGFQ